MAKTNTQPVLDVKPLEGLLDRGACGVSQRAGRVHLLEPQLCALPIPCESLEAGALDPSITKAARSMCTSRPFSHSSGWQLGPGVTTRVI